MRRRTLVSWTIVLLAGCGESMAGVDAGSLLVVDAAAGLDADSHDAAALVDAAESVDAHMRRFDARLLRRDAADVDDDVGAAPDASSLDDVGVLADGSSSNDGASTTPADGAVAACTLPGHRVDLVPSGQTTSCRLETFRSQLDVAYVAGDTDPDGPHRLDLYLPRGSGPFPLVIYVHGGGFVQGDEDTPLAAQRLVCAGFALASIDYRVASEAIFPAAIHDVKTAVRFLRANAASLSIDPLRIGIFGTSAGAHLAALHGTSEGVAALEGSELGWATTSSAVRAVAAFFPPVDFSREDEQLLAQGCPPSAADHGTPTSGESQFVGCVVTAPACADAVRAASPLTYVGGDEPPFLLVHGTEDCTVARAQSTLLADALLGAGSCAAERSYVGVGHAAREWYETPPQEALVNFFQQHL